MKKETRKLLSSSGDEVESFHIRLKELIGDDSIRSFGELIEASEGGIRKWLNNISKPSFDKVVRISRECNVSLEWLATGEGDKNHGKQEPTGTEITSTIINCGDFKEEYALIPGYHVRVSTGYGALNSDDRVNQHLAFRRKWLQSRQLHEKDLAVVFATGDSMEPTIHNGNTILVDISDLQLKDSSIYVLRFGEELYAKRLQKRYDGSIELLSDNKEYKDQIVRADELDQLAIIGKVVWIGKDLF